MQKIREQKETVLVNSTSRESSSSNGTYNIRSSQPQSIKEILGSADNRLIIAGIGNHIKNETAEVIKEEVAVEQPVQQSRRFKL